MYIKTPLLINILDSFYLHLIHTQKSTPLSLIGNNFIMNSFSEFFLLIVWKKIIKFDYMDREDLIN